MSEKPSPAVLAMLGRISVPAHSCVRVACENPAAVVYADPFQLAIEPHDADLILITHDHYDHYSPDDIAKVRKPETVFIMPKSMASAEVKGALGEANVRTVAPGEAIEACGVRIEAVAAYNVGKDFHTKASEWVGYVVEADGVRTYIAGDTDANEENLQVKCDIACVPTGGTYTFTAEEAAAYVARIKPAAAVPTHYGSPVGNAKDGATFAAALASLDPTIHVELKLGA